MAKKRGDAALDRKDSGKACRYYLVLAYIAVIWWLGCKRPMDGAK